MHPVAVGLEPTTSMSTFLLQGLEMYQNTAFQIKKAFSKITAIKTGPTLSLSQQPNKPYTHIHINIGRNNYLRSTYKLHPFGATACAASR